MFDNKVEEVEEFKEVEAMIVNCDEDWFNKQDQMQADALGFTVEQFREFSELESEEEMQAYIQAHSKK